MDRLKNPTADQLRIYRRRKRIMQRRRRRQRRLILIAIAAIAVVVILIAAFLSGAFEKRSRTNTLTLDPDGTVIFEEVGRLKDGTELKDFVREQIADYDEKNGDDAVVLRRFANDGEKYYVRTQYRDLSVYSDFTGYETFNGSFSAAKKAGYDLSAGFKTVSRSGDKVSSEDASGDAFRKRKVLIIKEWGISVKVPGTVTGLSSGSGVSYSPKNDTVTIKKQSDSGIAPLTYIFYK